jgi:hypothetical protein
VRIWRRWRIGYGSNWSSKGLRFRARLTLAACTVALVLMMATIYASLGFNGDWNASAGMRGQ